MNKGLLVAGSLVCLSGQAMAAENDELARLLAEQNARIQQLEARQAGDNKLSRVDLRISGYLNTGAGITSESGNNAPTYDGLGDEVSFTPLTSAGLQMEARVSDQLSGTLQFRAPGDEDFDSRLEWAYITYRPTSSLSVQAGQLVAPLYMHSQYRHVGYAYHWISVPLEVYNSAPLTNMQGVAASWQFNSGSVSHVVGLSYGNQTVDQVLAGAAVTVQADNITSINLRSTLGDLSLWAGYTRTNLAVSLPNLSSGGGPDLSPFSADDSADFISVGVQYDNGALVLNAEAIQLDSDIDWMPKDRAGYVLAGYRFGRFLPSVTWAMATNDGFKDIQGDPVQEGLFNSRAKEQKSWTFGVRADLTSNLALKAEVQSFYQLGDATQGAIPGVTPGTPSLWEGGVPDDDNPMVYRIAAQMVF